MEGSKIDINKFSPHLFWDVDIQSLSFEDNIHFIIKRTLGYGKLSDWMLLYNELGIEKISTLAEEISEIDEKSLAFLVALSGKKKAQFKCYTTHQSTPPHWNF